MEDKGTMVRGKQMEDMGMTDLQFKSFLRQLVKRLEDVREAKSEDAINAKLEDIIQDLKSDIES